MFSELCVRDNLRVVRERESWRSLMLDAVLPRRQDHHACVDEVLELLCLSEFADERPSELPPGIQKLVGIARALAGRPRILLLDEPAAGLDQAESEAFSRQLRDLVTDDIGVLLVEHDMRLVFDVSDQIVVLERGGILAVGDPEAVRRDGAVVAAYLGGSTNADAGRPQEVAN